MNTNDFVSRNRVGSEYWVNSENKTFTQLCIDNHLLYNKWKDPKFIKDTEYKDNVLKPVNNYVIYFYSKPNLIVSDKHTKLRQHTHAEIWVEPKKIGLYALDKTWQRQFYPSKNTYDIEADCFDAVYKFYVPWIIDQDVSLSIMGIEDSPFKILTDRVVFKKDEYLKENFNGYWIDFCIKKNGKHMKKYYEEDYGVIEISTPAYDILIDNDEILKRILCEYEK
jgi:hypothetical protein